MFEVTFIDSGKTEYLDYEECIEMFGEAEFKEIREGYLPHIVAVEVDEYDGQPDEAQEWYDFDPDC